jgi:membrane protease YdiL (CAAX protease family)
MRNSTFILLSPLAVVAFGTLVIRIAEKSLGVWAWVPWILTYWALLLLLVLVGAGRPGIKRWMGPPRGSWLWSALAVGLALPALTVFLGSTHLLRPAQVWVPWLLVALINPFLEEWYWRGLLLDTAHKWPTWLALGVTSLFFSLNHLLGIGVTSIGGRHPFLLLNTFVLGVIFGLIYKKTGSLRWVIVSHIIADLFGLSVPVFLNLWAPPAF